MKYYGYFLANDDLLTECVFSSDDFKTIYKKVLSFVKSYSREGYTSYAKIYLTKNDDLLCRIRRRSNSLYIQRRNMTLGSKRLELQHFYTNNERGER